MIKSDTMTFNAFGEATNCNFYKETSSGRRSCFALVDWYNASFDRLHCKGCPFFKTESEMKDQEARCASRLKKLRLQKFKIYDL